MVRRRAHLRIRQSFRLLDRFAACSLPPITCLHRILMSKAKIALPVLISSIIHQPARKQSSSDTLFSVLSYGVEPWPCVRHVEYSFSSPGPPKVSAKLNFKYWYFRVPLIPVHHKLKGSRCHSDLGIPVFWASPYPNS